MGRAERILADEGADTILHGIMVAVLSQIGGKGDGGGQEIVQGEEGASDAAEEEHKDDAPGSGGGSGHQGHGSAGEQAKGDQGYDETAGGHVGKSHPGQKLEEKQEQQGQINLEAVMIAAAPGEQKQRGGQEDYGGSKERVSQELVPEG